MLLNRLLVLAVPLMTIGALLDAVAKLSVSIGSAVQAA